MQFPRYLALLVRAERILSEAYRAVGTAHASVADGAYPCAAFARDAHARADELAAIADERYPSADVLAELPPPDFAGTRPGPLGLVRDLAELAQLAAFVHTAWELVGQAASGLRDLDLIDLAAGDGARVAAEEAWIDMKAKNEAAQALLAAR